MMEAENDWMVREAQRLLEKSKRRESYDPRGMVSKAANLLIKFLAKTAKPKGVK